MKDMRLSILPQPDDVTCGPTALHAVYRHFGLDLPLEELIAEVRYVEGGGTLAVHLGLDALARGFSAVIHSFNLRLFDPSWAGLDSEGLVEKLERQLDHKTGTRFVESSRAYQRFLRAGGHVSFDDLDTTLLERYFATGLPVLAGLSATYLYGSARELLVNDRFLRFDDVRGEPTGHFVVLGGMEDGKVVVSDPYVENPLSRHHHYLVEPSRLLHAILLGIVTYDANLLVLSRSAGETGDRGPRSGEEPVQ